jgi:hypothetical protein
MLDVDQKALDGLSASTTLGDGAAALLEVFAEDFLKAGDTASWAMADTMAKKIRAALPSGAEPVATDWPPLVDLGRVLGFFASVIKSGEPWSETCQREYDAANLALQAIYASPSSSPVSRGVRVKALEWSSEAPYSVARVPKLGLTYAIEAVWYQEIFQYVELSGGSARGHFPTVNEAKAAAQADYEARVRSALGEQP